MFDPIGTGMPCFDIDRADADDLALLIEQDYAAGMTALIDDHVQERRNAHDQSGVNGNASVLARGRDAGRLVCNRCMTFSAVARQVVSLPP